MISMRDILSGRTQNDSGDGYNNSIYGILSVYTYGILRLQELDQLDGNDLLTVR